MNRVPSAIDVDGGYGKSFCDGAGLYIDGLGWREHDGRPVRRCWVRFAHPNIHRVVPVCFCVCHCCTGRIPRNVGAEGDWTPSPLRSMSWDGAGSENTSTSKRVLKSRAHGVDGFIRTEGIPQVDLPAIEGGGVWQCKAERDDGSAELYSLQPMSDLI